MFINISSNERSKALVLLNKDKSVIIPLDGILNFLNAVKGYEETQKERERENEREGEREREFIVMAFEVLRIKTNSAYCVDPNCRI